MAKDTAGQPDLPVIGALPRIRSALDDRGAAVLVAPPGTGKTTGVPPALDEKDSGGGRTLVVVPRRMAARAAAARMAATHGGRVGDRFGYSVRHERRVGPRTTVEVVTTGLALRRVQADPGLSGISTVVLDEFHERSIEVDLLLALLCDVRSSLRDDLRLLVMSATLDAEPVARLLAGDGGGPVPVVRVEAPLHPVRTLHRPGSVHDHLADRVAEVVAEALRDTNGDILVFLPGRGEINATRRRLGDRLGSGVEVRELHGSLPPERQDEVLGGNPGPGRRVVLSTAVAETSVTVPGVRAVIDPGRRRTEEVDPRSGLPALVTRSVSLAGADQRRGRAGREAPGTCYRMWRAGEDELRRAADPPEVTTGDLSSLLLQTLAWGASSPSELEWLDPPPQDAVERARGLLGELGAVGDDGRITPRGREMASLGFHPRVAAIAVAGGRDAHRGLAAEVVAVLDAAGSGCSEVAEGVRALRSGRADPALRRAHRQWRRRLAPGDERSPARDTDDDRLDRDVARLVMAGFADRLARRRSGRRDVYHLRHGGEVELSRSARHLGEWEWVLAVDLDARTGSGRPGVLHLGAGVPGPELDLLLEREEAGGRITGEQRVEWDPASGAVTATTVRRLGAIELSAARSRNVEAGALEEAVAGAVRRDGPSVLPGWDATAGLRARVEFLRHTGVARSGPEGSPWPAMSEEALAERSRDWLPALVAEVGAANPFRPRVDQLGRALASGLGWEDRRILDREAPTHWRPPSGSPVPLRYGAVDGDPSSVLLRVRLQRMLGIDRHPELGRARVPVTVELLSPADRPVQRTLDLPGFWRGSYAQVRAEMRGRYPKHRWPEEPWAPA